MGYGGIFKRVVRIAVPIVVGFIGGGPLGVALASAAATGATGGSFKEALMAGATSYIGSSIGASVNSAISDGATSSALSGFETGVGGSGSPLSIGDTLSSGLYGTNEALTSGVSQFTDPLVDTGLGGFIENGVQTLRTPFDAFTRFGNDLLSPIGASLTAGVDAAAPTLLGGIIGGATTMTLNQALLAGTPEADDLLAGQGYTPQQIQLLKQEARNALSQGKFDEFVANTPNPGLSDEEFNQVLAAGIERRNIQVGPQVTRQQFDQGFENLTGEDILQEETDIRKQGFKQELGKSFTGNAFDPIDDDIINSIVEERSGPARQQISNYGARGNFNATGGQTANDILTQQTEGASNRVRDVGQTVLGNAQENINSIRNDAQSQIDNFKLGDDLFNPAPFAEQRQGLIDTQQSSLSNDIRGSLGSEPLFDINTALQAGGRSQGVVSGGTNQSFLDTIAAREGANPVNRNRRGLGTRGSGAF